jgi:hypothetical protein
VPFFSSSVPAGHLASLLRLPSQVPFDPGRPIELEELFQRELDVSRVDNEIVPYLKTEGRLRFFNALTVVLLPLDLENPQRLAREYPRETGHAPKTLNDRLESLEVGPVMLSHPSDNDQIGFLTWNTDLTLPVVLDGQHRFWAINQVVNQPSGRLRDQLAGSAVSVLFLVLDERAGFAAGKEVSVLEACREIFIDLNKHAQTVPTSRLYLLDDRNVNAVAMRSILAEGIDIDGEPPDKRVENTGRLPLGLIDWRGRSAKFETGPYLSSVLALHDIVQELADVPSFAPDSYDDARDAIERMEARLDLGEAQEFNRARLRREIDNAEAEERPFELPREAVHVAGEAFREKLGRRITAPFVRLLPYKELIDGLTGAGVLGSQLEPWLSFNESERRTLTAELGEDPSASVTSVWREIKGSRFPLAFQVVFQRAFISSIHSMLEQSTTIWSHWGNEGDPSEEEFIDVWINRFNRHIAPSLATEGGDSAYYGAGIRFDGTVDFRKTRVRVIAGLVTYAMLAPFNDWIASAKGADEDLTSDVSNWLGARWAEIRPGRPSTPIDGLFSTHGKNWRNGVKELIDARLEQESRDMDDREREDEYLDHGALQLSRMVEHTLDFE